MRGTNLEKTRGITLIALVITIIVLLILAGVAIAMLSGENGILRKAAEAKTKTENAQKQEEARLTDMELATYFATNNIRYQYSNGYITGFKNVVEDDGEVVYAQIAETVKDFEKELETLGYKISFKYDITENKDVAIEESEKKELKIATGMSVQKDGQTVARTVVFGDTNCDGDVDSQDAQQIMIYYDFLENMAIPKEFQKIAADVNNDGELNYKDAQIVYDTEGFLYELDQNRKINIVAKNIKRLYKSLQEYIKLLDKSIGYTFEYNSETDTYKLKGVKENTTAETLISKLPNSSELSVCNEKYQVVAKETVIQTGYHLKRTYSDDGNEVEPRFAYIEVEK